MNELKPDDVMRALECCSVYCNCNGCPYFDGVPEDDCRYKAMANALALLRENDAEIKGLIDGWSKDQDRFEQVCAEKDAEIERLKGRLDTRCDYCVAMDRAKAITEFAERLKGFYARLNGKTVGGSVEFHINQIEKELLGELQ